MKRDVRRCPCCGRKVRLMCETTHCGSRCRMGKCGHDSEHRRARMAA